MKFLVIRMEKSALLPFGFNGFVAITDGADIIVCQREIRLAHVAQFNILANTKHFMDGTHFIAHSKEKNILENKVQIEFLNHRAAAGNGLDHSHQFHTLDRFAQYIAAYAKHLAHVLFGRQKIAGLKLIADNIAAYFPKSLDIELVFLQVSHSVFPRVRMWIVDCPTNCYFTGNPLFCQLGIHLHYSRKKIIWNKKIEKKSEK